MEWTQENKEALLAFKDNIGSDDIWYKEKIKESLIANKFIIHVLNNQELEDADAEPDEYLGINILPFYILNPTQSNVKNYICYEVRFDEDARYNKVIKYAQIVFYILCHYQNDIDDETGLARHDLLAALLLEQFNYTNLFGNQFHCVSDVPSTVDKFYTCRTLIFEGKVTNNILDKQGAIINKVEIKK